LFPCRERGFILNEISDFSLLQNVLTITETHPAFCQKGLEAFSSLMKRLGDEDDHSHPPSVVVMNEWSYTTLPHLP
jgi:hypothetical protein